MTAQISDMFRYQEKEYLLIGIDEGKLFDISVLDLKPSWPSTACYRGGSVRNRSIPLGTGRPACVLASAGRRKKPV